MGRLETFEWFVETGEGTMEAFLLGNELFGKIRNHLFPIVSRYGYLELVLEKLREIKKPSKRTLEIIAYYGEAKKSTINWDSLAIELNELVQSAKEEGVELIYTVINDKPNPYILLNRILVDENKRKQGYGTRYLTGICEVGTKNQMAIALDISNTLGTGIGVLRKFYLSRGFKPCRKIGVSQEYIFEAK